MKNIIITGFMGTGKTSVGRSLAKELNLNFADTDGLIEKEAGISISEIFATLGEDYFRKLESKVIKEVSCRTNMVIATGGGAVINRSNLESLRGCGTIICLTASIDAILSRVREGDERPLFSGGNKREAVSGLLKAREPFYRKADFMIDTTMKSVRCVVQEIKEILGVEAEPKV